MDHQIIQMTHPPSGEATRSNDPASLMSSSLYVAVCKGQIEEVMALLLQKHAGIQDGQCDIHAVSAERNTVLHIAAEQGHGELIRELYVRFRDEAQDLLSARSSALDTPLHCAARSGSDAAVAILVQLARDCGECVAGCKNEGGETVLHVAARHGHGAAVETLVEAAPEMAAEVNRAGVSPLYLAVMSRSVRAVRAITATGRDASSVGPSAQNALHAAVFQISKMVDLLLEWEPSLASKADSNGSRPSPFRVFRRPPLHGKRNPAPRATEHGVHEGLGRPLGSPRRGADGPRARHRRADHRLPGRRRAPRRPRPTIPARRGHRKPLLRRVPGHEEVNVGRPPVRARHGRQHAAPPRGGCRRVRRRGEDLTGRPSSARCHEQRRPNAVRPCREINQLLVNYNPSGGADGLRGAAPATAAGRPGRPVERRQHGGVDTAHVRRPRRCGGARRHRRLLRGVQRAWRVRRRRPGGAPEPVLLRLLHRARQHRPDGRHCRRRPARALQGVRLVEVLRGVAAVHLGVAARHGARLLGFVGGRDDEELHQPYHLPGFVLRDVRPGHLLRGSRQAGVAGHRLPASVAQLLSGKEESGKEEAHHPAVYLRRRILTQPASLHGYKYGGVYCCPWPYINLNRSLAVAKSLKIPKTLYFMFIISEMSRTSKYPDICLLDLLAYNLIIRFSIRL